VNDGSRIPGCLTLGDQLQTHVDDQTYQYYSVQQHSTKQYQ
jgi:hypothetical protein